MIPTVVVTAGDPCGIGPEVILRSLGSSSPRLARVVVMGDLAVFRRAAVRLRLRLPAWRVIASAEDLALTARGPFFVDLGDRRRVVPGHPTARAGAAALAYLAEAVMWLKTGLAQALVTAPVTKQAIQRVVPSFEGHTEYLAAVFGAPRVVMAFVSPRMRVALLTRHVAVRDVARRVTSRAITADVGVLVDGLRRQLGVRSPRLAICGLNPHAGESGRFGDEERRVLAPALRQLRRRGVRIEGPFAADGFFGHQPRGWRHFLASGDGAGSAASPRRYDAVVCWYHDQGLIPFKLVSRDEGCQITFGLPFVRTSPDHGSALDIAARGGAHPGSMRYALRLAIRLARHAHA